MHRTAHHSTRRALTRGTARVGIALPFAVAAFAAAAAPAALAADTTAPESLTVAPSGATPTNAAPAITWPAVADLGGSGVAHYNVRRDGRYIASVAGTSFTDPAALADGTYSYTVRAEDGDGNKAAAFSPAVNITLDRVAPAAPAGVAAAGTDVPTITWDAVAGAVEYRVVRDGAQLATVAAPTYTDSSVTAGGSYAYTVVAVDAAGNVSAPSAPASFATLVPEPPAPVGQLALFPDSSRNAHFITSMHVWGAARIPDLATAQRMARDHDIISVNPTQTNGYADAMRLANPNLRLFVYVNGMFAQSTQGSTFPASWYMDGKFGKVRSVGFGNYLMDPRSTASFSDKTGTYNGWKDFVVSRCDGYLARYPWLTGCFVDMLGTAPLSAGYNMNKNVPINSATGQEFTEAQYLHLTGSVGSAIEASTGRPVLGNGLASGRRFYAAPTSVLFDHFTAGDAEVWMRAPGSAVSAYPTLTTWKQNVQMLIDAEATGNAVQATVKTWSGGTDAQKEAWREYGLASYLIGNSGHAYFEFTSGTDVLPWNEHSPLYDLPIGAPTETYATADAYLESGVYQRDFTSGKVLVNPSTAAVTVPLGGTYTTRGGATVTQVTIPANGAEILTK